MSASPRGRTHRRTLCAMVQLHYWTPRTTDPVTMPLHSFAVLASSLATSVVNAVCNLADASSAKGASPKQSGKKDKEPSDSASQAQAFSNYLTAAAASLAAIPLPPAAKIQPTPQPGSTSQSGVGKSPKGAVVSLPTYPVGASTGAKTSAPTATVKLPTAPATNVSARGLVHATPDSIQAARAAAESKSSASTTPRVPAKPLSREGKGEAHLGTHTNVESPTPETPSLDHEPAETTHSVTSGGNPVAVESPRPIDTTSVSGESAPATVTAHVTASAQAEQRLPAPVEANASSEATPRLLAAAATSGSAGKSSVQQVARLVATPISATRGETQPSAATTPATTAGTSVSATLAMPSVSSASQSSPSAAPTAVQVSEQLTRALVAQADVVQRDGRTDLHLRLEPPQLGSVQIHLTATEHTVSARIVVAQEGTRQLLEGQAHQLRQGLAQAGLSLGSFDVTRDGGGANGGGQQAPERSWSPPTPGSNSNSKSLPSPVVSTPVSRPKDGINILA